MTRANDPASSLDAYALSAGLFSRGLANLKTILTKAEAHAAATGDATLIDAQLAGDMNNLGIQVHWATEGSRLAVARLLGTAPSMPSPNDAKSLAELKQRIDAAIGYLGEIVPSELEAGLDRVIVMQARSASKQFSGKQFLVEFAIPNFYFHLTTAYCILRHRGVALTKADFMGGWG